MAMAASLACAAVVVLFAGRLTSLDASAVSNVHRINADLKASKERLSQLYTARGLISRLIKARSDLEETKHALKTAPPAEGASLSDKAAELASAIDAYERSLSILTLARLGAEPYSIRQVRPIGGYERSLSVLTRLDAERY